MKIARGGMFGRLEKRSVRKGKERKGRMEGHRVVFTWRADAGVM